MKGSYPKILDDPERGPEAKKLFDDAKAMLEKIKKEKWITASGVAGIFPALAVGDDIELFEPDGRVKAILHTLRQQTQKPAGTPNIALSDFIWPKEIAEKNNSGLTDFVGAFAVTA